MVKVGIERRGFVLQNTDTKMTMPWFRFYNETIRDRKITRVCISTGQPKAVVLGVWVTLLAMASESPERGVLLISDDMPITFEEIVFECGVLSEIVASVLEAFQRMNMLAVDEETFHITNWNNRQFDSDNSTSRVKRYRQRKAEKPEQNDGDNGNDDETFQKRSNHVIESESESESDTESELPASGASAPPQKSTKPTTAEKLSSQAMFSALADVTKTDLALITGKDRGALNQAEKKMRDNGYTPQDVEAFGRWWYANDWRGKKGDPPTLQQVRSEWGKFKANGTPKTVPKTMQPPKRTPEQEAYYQELLAQDGRI